MLSGHSNIPTPQRTKFKKMKTKYLKDRIATSAVFFACSARLTPKNSFAFQISFDLGLWEDKYLQCQSTGSCDDSLWSVLWLEPVSGAPGQAMKVPCWLISICYYFQLLLSSLLFLSQKAFVTWCFPIFVITLEHLLLNELILLGRPHCRRISPWSSVTHGELSLKYSENFYYLGGTTPSATSASAVPLNKKVHDVYCLPSWMSKPGAKLFLPTR